MCAVGAISPTSRSAGARLHVQEYPTETQIDELRGASQEGLPPSISSRLDADVHRPVAPETRLYLGLIFPGKVRILADLRDRERQREGGANPWPLPRDAERHESFPGQRVDLRRQPELPDTPRATRGRVMTEPSRVSDETLMLRYQRGDRAAFGAIVRRYERPLFNFVLRYLRSREAAEEVTQESFLKVVKNANEFKHEARFSTWLYAIARNLCVDHGRRMKHRAHASLDAAPLSSPDAAPLLDRVANHQLDGDVDRTVAASEIRVSVVRAVEDLPDDQREVFLLREIAGLPFREIATVVGVGENTIKSRMRYALERLRDALSDFEEYARARR
jgi:RNA polymerase sigma-70 factor (ECF subfamily)